MSTAPPAPHSTDASTASRDARRDARPRAGRWIAAAGRFFCHDPLLIGGVAVALMLGTTGLLHLPVSLPLLVAAFCGTVLVYNADRSLGWSPEDVVNRPDRVAWVRRHHTWLRVEAMAAAVGVAWAVPGLRLHTLVAAAGVGALALLHVLPLLPGRRRLKAHAALKPLVVATAWSVGGVVLPVVEAGGEAGVTHVGAVVGALVAYRFAFIAPNVFYADWADRTGDAAAGLKTWTAAWSARGLRTALTLTLAAGGAGAVAATAVFRAPALLLVDAAGLGGMAVAVWRLHPGTSAAHALWLDLLVGWPGAAVLLAWAAGG